ncbi:MAG: hypothetical protein AMXMBFR25_12780 [Lysobacterales bacterium]
MRSAKRCWRSSEQLAGRVDSFARIRATILPDRAYRCAAGGADGILLVVAPSDVQQAAEQQQRYQQ